MLYYSYPKSENPHQRGNEMPIIYDEKKRVFKLDTPNTTYAFHVTNSNHLLHLYYGASIPETDITHMLRIPNDEPFYPRHTTEWDRTPSTVLPSSSRQAA